MNTMGLTSLESDGDRIYFALLRGWDGGRDALRAAITVHLVEEAGLAPAEIGSVTAAVRRRGLFRWMPCSTESCDGSHQVDLRFEELPGRGAFEAVLIAFDACEDPDLLALAGITSPRRLAEPVEHWYPTVAGPLQRRGAIGLSAMSHWVLEVYAARGELQFAVLATDQRGAAELVGTTTDSDFAHRIARGDHAVTVDALDYMPVVRGGR